MRMAIWAGRLGATSLNVAIEIGVLADMVNSEFRVVENVRIAVFVFSYIYNVIHSRVFYTYF